MPRDVQSYTRGQRQRYDGPIVYVVRHGETAQNKNKVFRGFEPEGLDDTGRAQAREAGRDLAHVDSTPFQYIQCYAERSVPREGQLSPVAGAFHVVLGHLPVPEATAGQLRAAARSALERLDPYPDYIAKDLLQHGGGRFERAIRFACTDVWPVLYQVLCLQQPDPVQVWTLPKRQAIALL